MTVILITESSTVIKVIERLDTRHYDVSVHIIIAYT